jgi:DNA-binding response OmpR family regulator
MKPFLLIGESDNDLRDILAEFFRKQGLDVVPASDGLDCLQHLRRTRPAVFVLDAELIWGGSDGLLAVMRDDRGLREVPVILTTTTVLQECVTGPIVQTLLKPYSLSVLLDSVRAVVAGDARTPGLPRA